MTDYFHFGDLSVKLTRKDIKNVHLTVHPPNGHITLAAPIGTRTDVARAYAISRLDWIRKQQAQLASQNRETKRQFITRESHYLWGKRYLLDIQFKEQKPGVTLDHRKIYLQIRPGSSRQKRCEIMHEWHKTQLHREIPPLLRKWEKKMGVSVAAYFLQRMKTKWGSCNHKAGNLRLNTELVKKPKDLLEYIIVHEMIHLIEATHSERFFALLTKHYPRWQEARAELNELPLSPESWPARP